MSDTGDGENEETLFSFELLVECVRVDKDLGYVSDQLAVAVRLLDFPTLLIHQPTEHTCNGGGQYTFNRGKSCFFLMNLRSLHTYLRNTPLYAMVLDMKEDVPRLMGSSLVSLAEVMDRVARDVTQQGVCCASSSHGERGVFIMRSLTGEKMGSISLSYKLVSLGTSVLPHVEDRTRPESSDGHPGGPGGRRVPIEDISNITPNTPAAEVTADKVHVEHETRSPETRKGSSLEEDFAHFCPPPLYYTNIASNKEEAHDCQRVTLDSKDVISEDLRPEVENGNFTPASPKRSATKTSRNQEAGNSRQNLLGESLRQLPLLNALLVELAQLNCESPQQPMSIHPNLAWLYQPSSAEPPPNAQRDSGGKTPEKRRQEAKLIHSPRDCSTPILGNSLVREQEGAVTHLKSPGGKFVYGTTKTFNLRMKRLSPKVLRLCDSMNAKQNQKEKNTTKIKTKRANAGKRKSPLRENLGLNENIATMMENITVDTVNKSRQRNVHSQEHEDSLSFSKDYSVSERRDLKCIQIPCAPSDSVAETKSEHHDLSLSDPDRDNIQSAGSSRHSSSSSRHSSPKSSISRSRGEGNEEEEDYADDFNSLEPSEACSPDPASSPEAPRAKSSSPPWYSDFRKSTTGPESLRQRRVVPPPVRALSSPKRSLRASDVIRPGTQAPALSISDDDDDDDDDGDRDGSLRTVCSGKQTAGSSHVKGISGAESGEGSESEKYGSRVGRTSLGSASSSVEPLGAEEDEDEDGLGTLDLRKDYKHISELVANKLPGYTM